MRRAAVVVAALSVPSALVACTLLTSLDGFTGAPDPRSDGASETAPNESGSDAAPNADSGGSDARPSPSDLYAAAVLADKPLGYWRLEETSGTNAKDETGRHDGVYVRSPILGQPGVAGGRGVKLPRSSHSHIHVASSAFRFLGNAAHSNEVWVQPGDIKDYQWIGTPRSHRRARREAVGH